MHGHERFEVLRVDALELVGDLFSVALIALSVMLTSEWVRVDGAVGSNFFVLLRFEVRLNLVDRLRLLVWRKVSEDSLPVLSGPAAQVEA